MKNSILKGDGASVKFISNTGRITKIREILFNHTDENHELSILEIIDHLKLHFGSDYKVSKNTVRSSIHELRECGFNIEESVKENNTIYYSHQYRKFEIHELRMLIDAVSSARFITSDESKQLIEKIKALTSKHLAKKLHHHISIDPAIRARNKEVRYHIDKIHTSITEQKILHFQYGNFNIKKEFVLRHHGMLYTVIPLGLVWNNDYYYLVAKNPQENEIKHYRVDRMKNVSVSEERFVATDFSISDHMKQTFNMYPGTVEYVEIHFDNHLVNVVIDRFGKDVTIRKVDDCTFSIKIKAAISEGFIRWLLMWGSDAKVISPQHLVEKMKAETEKMNKLYS
ncbi:MULTISPECIES: helix-turn-helix transcriptional regulator [Paenibacillaceae]|uniref:helix-turn-helix transcriptional regulator n=1 Tax=Paenibacillaceae TaxID=186822 RepID=UPI001562AABA|nr:MULTISPECIES: WYL domain-containing protein [Brevibacillus]MBE5394931.1 WYL domain-containing protein [Brevibacillus borstelensis]MCG5252935.1 WYL domain-containing protein [Brevibacillus agri]MCM3472216.1 WYL domain-containing protein [Brevibacillus borstelensis]MED1852215.1 WYL domain-containing protein [Brevibacillus borstelensis]WNF05475.1 WYL domain-containing protein [Brevibacillus borstelensis]